MGPTIFDVLEVSPGVGNATVNATTFNVTCGSVPGKLLVAQPGINIPETPLFADDNSTLIFFAEQLDPEQMEQPLAVIDWQFLRVLFPSTRNFHSNLT